MFRATLINQATALNRALQPTLRPAASFYVSSISRCTSLTRCTHKSRYTSRNLSSKSKDAHQEAIDKAQELHAELKEMIEAQKVIKQTQAQTTNTSSFVAFLKGSKPQIFNIFFAFICVLMAHQLHGLRMGYKKLAGEMEVKEGEVERLRKKLRDVCDIVDANEDENEKKNDQPSFAMSVSEKCTKAIGDIFADSDRKPGYTWILARKLASGDAMESSRVEDAIRQIVTDELRNAVGDAVWSEEELKQKRVSELKSELSAAQVSGSGDAQLSGLVEMLEQVHEEDLVDGVKKSEEGRKDGKVKRTRYAI